MQSLASVLPEYPVSWICSTYGPTLGPQLIAEIGDVRRFYSKKALVAYAGLDAPPNDSGDVTGRHKSMSKIGASSLRRTLFLVMSVYLQTAPLDEPVCQFMDRKRAEGKALPRLHDGFRQQVSADLLRHCKSLFGVIGTHRLIFAIKPLAGRRFILRCKAAWFGAAFLQAALP